MLPADFVIAAPRSHRDKYMTQSTVAWMKSRLSRRFVMFIISVEVAALCVLLFGPGCGVGGADDWVTGIYRRWLLYYGCLFVVLAPFVHGVVVAKSRISGFSNWFGYWFIGYCFLATEVYTPACYQKNFQWMWIAVGTCLTLLLVCRSIGKRK